MANNALLFRQISSLNLYIIYAETYMQSSWEIVLARPVSYRIIFPLQVFWISTMITCTYYVCRQ